MPTFTVVTIKRTRADYVVEAYDARDAWNRVERLSRGDGIDPINLGVTVLRKPMEIERERFVIEVPAPRTEEATCTCHLGPNSPRPCPVTHTAGSEEATEPAGLWRCSSCGDAYDFETTEISRWRWTGTAYEHKCPGSHPQAGHFPAEWFGGPKPTEPARCPHGCFVHFDGAREKGEANG